MRIQSIVIFFLLLGALSTSTTFAQKSINLSPADFEKGMIQKNIQVLDVRTQSEYQSGHLKNALLADWTNKEHFNLNVQQLDKSKTVYIYCHSGGRSSEAAKWLIKNKYTVYNLEGGISAWKNAGKPLE